MKAFTALERYLTLGSIAGVNTQMRPPQISDFGGGGLQSPIVINGLTGEAWIYVNGVMVPLNTINLKSFGAVGDGVKDDYVSIMAAIAAAQARGPGTVIWVPRGVYAHSQGIVVAGTPVQIWGEGSSSSGYSPAIATTGTEFKYTGPAGATSFTFNLCQASHGLRHIGINGSGLSATGLIVDACTYGIHEDVSIAGVTGRGFITRCTLGQSCSWNTFRNITINVGGVSSICGLWVTGAGVTNSCHNTYQDFLINTANAANGINLGYCDNNRFIGMYINSSGTGKGVQTIPTEHGGFPVGNYFFHLQAGPGGWDQPAGQVDWNMIIGYDRSNGQPAPSVPVGSKLLYLDGWGGWNTFLNVASAAAGGGDPRTAADFRNAGAALVVGYQGGALTTIDCADTRIRDAVGALIAQFSTGKINVAGRVDVGSSTGNVFAKGATALAVGADCDTVTAGSGLYLVRNLTNSGTALVLVDIGLATCTEVSDPAAIVTVGADPGAGANQLWVTVTGTTLRVRNRYVAAKDIAVACVSLYGTPA